MRFWDNRVLKLIGIEVGQFSINQSKSRLDRFLVSKG